MTPTAGSTEAWRADDVAARERTVLWRYLRALGASPHEAEDLCQEAFTVALATGRPADDGKAGPFLRGVARKLWLRTRRWWHRRREREVAAAVEELWLATAAHDGGDGLLAALRSCLELLQPRARNALDLHYRDGLSWPVIGARLGLAKNGIKTLAQRTRAALRHCLERRNP